MQRIPVVSKTGMTGYAYDPKTETLEISFQSRKANEPDPVYHYTPFKQADFDAFMAAESKGSHFLRVVKPGFKCEKQQPEKKTDDGQAV